VKNDYSLAVEENAVGVSSEVWRVVSTQTVPCGDRRSLRNTNWFATERAARKHAEWIESIGGAVHCVQGFAAIAGDAALNAADDREGLRGLLKRAGAWISEAPPYQRGRFDEDRSAERADILKAVADIDAELGVKP
jgi:hypothetical protein